MYAITTGFELRSRELDLPENLSVTAPERLQAAKGRPISKPDILEAGIELRHFELLPTARSQPAHVQLTGCSCGRQLELATRMQSPLGRCGALRRLAVDG